jgi:hypothetical protein
MKLACALMALSIVVSFVAAPVAGSGYPISWSAALVAVTVGDGKPAPATTISFRSGDTLHDIVIDVAPAIKGFVSLSQNAFGTVLANQVYPIQLDFAVPPYASEGTYSGTLRMRTGKRTVALPLQIVISLSFGSSVILPGTKVLSPNTAQLISGVSGDGRILTFSANSKELNSLKLGDILVIGVSPGTPNGFLGKITDISGQQPVIISTALASLSEVFENLDISTSSDVLAASNPSSRLAQISPQVTTPTWSMELTDILYDADGDATTTGDQLRATANVSGSTGVDFNLSIAQSEISSLYFAGRAAMTATLTTESDVSLLSFNSSHTFDKPEISKTFVIWAGYVPIVLTAKIQLTVGAEGSVSAGMETSVTDSSTIVAGASYSGGVVSPVSTFSNTFDFDPPTFTAKGDLKVWAGPALRLFVYDVIGPELDVKPFVEGEVTLSPGYHWKLFAGLDVGLAIAGEVFAFDFLDIEIPALISFKHLLAEGPDVSQGQIVFIKSGDVWIMNTDGSSQHALTSIGGASMPRFANGVVTFKSNGQLYETNTSGSVPQVIPNTAGVLEHDLKPDGSAIALTYGSGNNFILYRMGLDGSALTAINTTGNLHQVAPYWGRDGYIYFDQAVQFNPFSQKVYRIPENGINNPTLLVSYFSQYAAEGGSPLGKVAFLWNQPSPQVRLMNADGSGQVDLSNSPSGVSGRIGFDYDSNAIYYSTGTDIRRINIDGTGDTLLASGTNGELDYGK